MGMLQPTSPVVMRVASIAKGLGSPHSSMPSQEHSSPQITYMFEDLLNTPLSSRKTPGCLTADDKLFQRSARLSCLDPSQM